MVECFFWFNRLVWFVCALLRDVVCFGLVCVFVSVCVVVKLCALVCVFCCVMLYGLCF